MNNEDADGTLHTENGLTVLRFERRLGHPAGKVWHALTDAEAMRHWFPQDVTADLRPGGKMMFTFRPSGDYGDIPPFEGEVLEFEPPRVFAYRWGTDLLRWELRPTDDGCLLIFTDTLRRPLPIAGSRSTPATSSASARRPPRSGHRQARGGNGSR